MAGIEVPPEVLVARSEVSEPHKYWWDDDSDENTQEMRGVIDTDGDGELTKMEFIKNAMKCEFVCDMLTVGFEEDDDDEDDEDFE